MLGKKFALSALAVGLVEHADTGGTFAMRFVGGGICLGVNLPLGRMQPSNGETLVWDNILVRGFLVVEESH